MSELYYRAPCDKRSLDVPSPLNMWRGMDVCSLQKLPAKENLNFLCLSFTGYFGHATSLPLVEI